MGIVIDFLFDLVGFSSFFLFFPLCIVRERLKKKSTDLSREMGSFIWGALLGWVCIYFIPSDSSPSTAIDVCRCIIN